MASSRHLHGHLQGIILGILKGSCQTCSKLKAPSSFHLEFKGGVGAGGGKGGGGERGIRDISTQIF